MADGVTVRGLKEFRSELKRAGSEFPRELRKANLKAAQVVADAAKQDYASGPGSSRKVVPTVKALAQQGRGQVKVGGGSSVGGALAMGNTFGSNRFKQFPPTGLYGVWEVISRTSDEVVDVYADALEDLSARAFPD